MNLSESESADEVTVGTGAAGLAAAITSHDAGARVVILEKMPPERAGGNIDPDGLAAEVARYNEWVAAGTDDPMFGRVASAMRPIARPPFYGYPWAQQHHHAQRNTQGRTRARPRSPW